MRYIFFMLASTTSLVCMWRPEKSTDGLGSLSSGLSALGIQKTPENPLLTKQTKSALERLGYFGEGQPSLERLEELYSAKRRPLQKAIEQLDRDYKQAKEYMRHCNMAQRLPRTYKPTP